MKILKLASLFVFVLFFQNLKAQNLEFKKGLVLKGTETAAIIKTLSVARGKSKYEVKDASGNVLVNLNEVSTPEKPNLYILEFPSLANEKLAQTVPSTSMNFEKAIFQYLYIDAKLLSANGVETALVNSLIATTKPKPVVAEPIKPSAPVVAAVAKNPNYFKEQLKSTFSKKETDKMERYFLDNRRKTSYTLTSSPNGADVKNGLTLTSNIADLDWTNVHYPMNLKFHLFLKNNTNQPVKYIYARSFHHLFYAKIEVIKDGITILSRIIDDKSSATGFEREKFDKSNLRMLKPGELFQPTTHLEIPKLDEGNYTIKASYKIDKSNANPLYVDAKYLTQFDNVELFMQDINFKIEMPKGVVNANIPAMATLAPFEIENVAFGFWDALQNPDYAIGTRVGDFDVEKARYLKNLVNLKYLYIEGIKDMAAFKEIKDLNLKGLVISFRNGANNLDWNAIPANFLKANCLESLFLIGGRSEQLPIFLANQKNLKKLLMNMVQTNIAQIPTYFPALDELSFNDFPKSDWYKTASVSALKNAKKLEHLSIISINLDNIDFLAEMPSLKKVTYIDANYKKVDDVTYPVLKKLSDKNVQVYFYDVK